MLVPTRARSMATRRVPMKETLGGGGRRGEDQNSGKIIGSDLGSSYRQSYFGSRSISAIFRKLTKCKSFTLEFDDANSEVEISS